MRLVACLACLALAACASAPAGGPAGRGPITSVRFGQAILPKGVARSNADLAEDFLDLTFQLENGEKLSHLLRYETPVRVYLRSPELGEYRPDLTALLVRLRAEAGIDIAETGDPEAAQIFIEAVPAAQIAKVFPTAACFIVPGETDWTGFVRRRPDARVRWPDQATLTEAAIFLPLDTTPQDVRVRAPAHEPRPVGLARHDEAGGGREDPRDLRRRDRLDPDLRRRRVVGLGDVDPRLRPDAREKRRQVRLVGRELWRAHVDPHGMLVAHQVVEPLAALEREGDRQQHPSLTSCRA